MDIEEELNKLSELGFDICTAEGIIACYTIDEYNHLCTDLQHIEMYYPEEDEYRFITYYTFEEIKTTLEILKNG